MRLLVLHSHGKSEGREDKGRGHRACRLRKVRTIGPVCSQPQGTGPLPSARKLVPRARAPQEDL